MRVRCFFACRMFFERYPWVLEDIRVCVGRYSWAMKDVSRVSKDIHGCWETVMHVEENIMHVKIYRCALKVVHECRKIFMRVERYSWVLKDIHA